MLQRNYRLFAVVNRNLSSGENCSFKKKPIRKHVHAILATYMETCRLKGQFPLVGIFRVE